MQSIAPNQDKWCFCGKPAASEPHHIIHKSMGGTFDRHDHNALMVCPECHAKLHPEKMGGRGWRVETNSAQIIRVVDREGNLVYEQELNPAFDQGSHIANLGLLPGYLAEMTEEVKFLDREGLESAATLVSQQFGKSAWIYLGTVLLVARRRMVHGTAEHKLSELAGRFGIGLRQAQFLMKIMETYETKSISSSPLESSTMFTIAARQDDPQEALRLAEEVVADNPRATVKEVEQVLQSKDPLHRDFCTGDVIDGECTECGAKPRHLRKQEH